ncbi:site-specific DNA-methyltransferase [Clostridium felsineum]|uniref:site-specific DNA-methyltransferase n=1 Tax=Clostridium felsineum TaxID=36839 RepID=UPI00098C7E1A|nr:site-specific DNA-methyltransferase [Clostridium felsineum]URZ03185.1 hypothetical protein CLAUR_032310 [Clostridium felsineum]
MERMNGETLNIVADNINKLKEIFPEVFNEDKVDFEKLEAVLGEYKDTGIERYNFTWPGKSKAIRISQTSSTGTLRPCKEESKDWDTTQNLYIEGDNLEVLKLLQKSYYGKVKMIYIDPPYNTGNDFVYKDDFKDNIENYLQVTGQKDSEGNKTTTNTESNGRYHSNWLNMMYPRLRLARNLLEDNGVVFISIDDNEVTNLKRMCDEIFGEENFMSTFIWEKRVTRENRKIISVRHDYLLCYTKNCEYISESIGLLPMNEAAIERYKNPDNDLRGNWTSVPAIAQAGHGTSNQFYTLTTPSGRKVDPPSGSCWRYTKERMNEAILDNRIWFGTDGNGVPRIKKFLSEGKQGLTPETLLKADDVGTNDSAKRELVNIFNGIAVFETPKPTTLLKHILEISSCESSSIVMDFFSGTAPMAQAVMQNNVEENKKNKFLMVQIPEEIDTKSEAYKAGYKNICEIGKERIRRAGDKIKEENKDKEGIGDLDIGFKVFKLDSSNINRWDSSYNQDLEHNLLSSIDNIKEGRSEEDILYEVLLKYGIDLNMPIEEHDIAGKKVFDIGFGAIIACLDDNITLEVVEEMGKLKEKLNPNTCRVVFMDNGFSSDSVKTNAVQILKIFEIEDIKSI